ncbi:MAG: bifunctional nuclease family protein [Prevotellaceae bacterium]|jgi:bifunctional DNase/RNase|nr:bifunctional nuclease family protein [Prevotellaceae bacterium]
MEAQVKLNVIGLTYSQVQNTAYALVLGEENGSRRIAVVIGAPEAQAIAMNLQGLQSSRPLTHDLFISLISAYGISMLRVNIYKFEKDIFYSELVFRDASGKEVRIDSRTSDAIALAVRVQCPIFITEEIMAIAGVHFEGDENASAFEPIANREKREDTPIKELSKEELEKQIEEAIQTENYEQARILSDELKKRN